MAIGDKPFAVFRVTDDTLRDIMGDDRFDAVMARLESGEMDATTGTAEAKQRYIYTAVMDAKTCQLCAPHHGAETTGGEPGELSDEGIPNPPTHDYCRCRLVPVEAADAADDPRGPANEGHLEWLSGLGQRAQEAVVGKTKAALLRAGEIAASDLYDETGRLRTLEEMGFTARGKRLRR